MSEISLSKELLASGAPLAAIGQGLGFAALLIAKNRATFGWQRRLHSSALPDARVGPVSWRRE